MAQTSLVGRNGGGERGLRRRRVCDLHWFAVAGLFEYLRRHVAWRSACCGEDVELLFIHYS